MDDSKVKPKNTGQFGKNNKGKPKGAVNKTTGQLKDMILKALDQAGGETYLLDRANDPKTQSAFLQLIGKVLPMTVVGDANQPLTFTLATPWLNQSIAKRNGD
jgi:hypothetical protein